MEQAELVLAYVRPLLGRLAVPARRLGRIARHASSVAIQIADDDLAASVPAARFLEALAVGTRASCRARPAR
jgi:hypothetical protein